MNLLILCPPPGEPPPITENSSFKQSRNNRRGGNRPYTAKEEERIERCHRLHLNGHYSPRKMKKLILYVPNCDLTSADVDNWADWYWPCQICTEGSIKTAPQLSYAPPTNALPGEYWEADLIFTEFEASSKRKRPGMLFICLVTGMLFYHPMQSKATAAMKEAGTAFRKFTERHYPNTSPKVIRTDHEDAFESVAAQIRGCQNTNAAIGDHANHVERANGVIKPKALCAIRSLVKQGIQVPRHLISNCYQTMAQIMNHYPSSHLQGASPASFAQGIAKLTLDNILDARFGRIGYFKKYPVPQDQTESRGELGMVVGFEPATPTNLLIYVPKTNSIVSRGTFQETADISEFKELMAYRAKGATIDENSFSTDNISISFSQSPQEPFDTSEAIDGTGQSDIVAAIINSLKAEPSAAVNYDISALNVPMRAAQAISIFGLDEVSKGVLKELDNLLELYQVVEFVSQNQIPKGAVMLGSKDIYKAKTKNGEYLEIKCRIAAQGCGQPNKSFGQTSSPTVDSMSVNAMLSLAKFYKATLSCADVPAAYLNSDLREIIYMKFSKEMSKIIVQARPELAIFLDDKGHLLVRLNKSLYGLKQAGANWHNDLVATILEAGFFQCTADPCVFYTIEKGIDVDDKICIICIHVDDILRISNNPAASAVLEAALAKYGDLKWETGIVDYLGVHYEQQPDFSIKADMTAMTERILAKRQITTIKEYPSVHNLFEQFDDDKEDYSMHTSDFLSQIGEVAYLTKVRIDIAKETSYLAGLAKNPGPIAFKHLRHLQSYLLGTKNHYVVYGTEDPSLNLYVDAAFAVHPRDSRSHGGIYITLGNHTGPIYVRSSKVKAVCTSICEAELWKLVEGVQQCYPVAKLLTELGAIEKLHFTVHEDNEATIIVSYAGEGRTTGSKHFRVRHHFLKELIDDGTIIIKHCRSEDMVPDYLTKGMVGEPYVRLTTKAMNRRVFKSTKQQRSQP